MWCCCEQTLTFGVRFTQHGDGCGAGVNRPLPLVSDSPSMEMDVVLLWIESDLSVCPNTAKLIFRSPGLPTETEPKTNIAEILAQTSRLIYVA